MCCSDPHEGVRKVEAIAKTAFHLFTDVMTWRLALTNNPRTYSEFQHGRAVGRLDEIITQLMSCTRIPQGQISLMLENAHADLTVDTEGTPVRYAEVFSVRLLDQAPTIYGSCGS